MSVLASHLHPIRGEDDPTGIALMAEYIYGGKGVLFWITQLATFAILILAANTAYQGFPGLSSIIARDGYMPRQLANRGDKLVFSNGIIFLAVAAGILITVFKGNISALIPLYAFGVFTGFTLSQAGMVRHHLKYREGRWRASLAINAVGCVATATVAIVVVVSKFTEGAWIPAVLIPAMVVGFRAVNKHYARVRAAVQVDDAGYTPLRRTHLVVVLVGTVHKGVHRSRPLRQVAGPRAADRGLGGHRPRGAGAAAKAWTEFGMPIELHTIASPYRELTHPVLEYLDELDAESPDDVITVVIPEFVTQWKTQWLHNQSAFALKARLLYRPNTVVTSVPVLIDADETRRDDAVGTPAAGGPEWRRCSSGSRTRWPSRTRVSSTCALGDKVRATIDLPGVAEGTEGKVMLANGFNWQRYRVRFPDGTELGDLDQRTHRPDRPRRQAPGQGGGQGRLTHLHCAPRPGSGAAW